MFVVISYDIPDDKRRTKVMKTLKNYGAHVQYSVFECDLNDTQFAGLKKQLGKLIVLNQDSVRFYFLCADDVKKIRAVGVGPPVETTLEWKIVSRER